MLKKSRPEFAEDDDSEGYRMTAGPVKLRFDVTPDEAIDYFKSKRIVTRKEFDKLSDDARAAAFTVSGVYKQDVLGAFKDEITNALEQGTAQSKVIKRFKDILAGAGHRELGNFHLETIIRTNLMMSYGTARRRALEEVADDLPFWEYHAVMDDRVRPTHAALNNLVLPANHPFWTDHYPPWGFSCRCSVSGTDKIPDDYKHSNPSGETGTTIFYDRNGMPAKAEIGTSVYDLAAEGNFQGVPPQGGLRQVIESASVRARAGRTGRGGRARAASSESTQPLDRSLDKVERQIARRKTEKAVVLDYQGKVIAEKTSRSQDEVVFDVEQVKSFRGKIFTHNHPVVSAFSPEDIEFAMEFGLAQLRLVDRKYKYVLIPGPEGWSLSTWESVERILGQVKKEVGTILTEKIVSGKMSEDQFDEAFWHEVWDRIAKQTGLKYERRRW